MNMVKSGARLECLRCGHVEKPVVAKAAPRIDPRGVDVRR
jgi:hypothetical protein